MGTVDKFVEVKLVVILGIMAELVNASASFKTILIDLNKEVEEAFCQLILVFYKFRCLLVSIDATILKLL